MSRGRAGTSLMELVVVLFLLAFLIGFVIPALTAAPRALSRSVPADSARILATRTGRPASIRATDSTPDVFALPDGRVLVGESLNAR